MTEDGRRWNPYDDVIRFVMRFRATQRLVMTRKDEERTFRP